MIWRSALFFLTGLAAFTVLAGRGREASDVFAQTPPSTSDQAAESSAESTALLSVGTRGEAVGTLQQQLQQRGYYDGPVDGLYGSITRQAVETFQQDVGIPATGKIDIFTWERLHTSQQPEAADAIVATADAPQIAEASLNVQVAQSPPEPETVPDTAPQAETTSPDAASDESSAEPEAVTSGSTSDSTNDSGSGRFLIFALIGAALAALGTGFAVFNQGKPKDVDESAWGEIPQFDTRFDQEPGLMPSTTTAAFPVSPTPRSNGYPSASIPVADNGGLLGAGSTREQGTDAEIHQMGETTRLAKVNITNELINELQSSDPSKRRKAIWELGQRGNSTAIQPLVNAMIDADSKEKSLALAALSEIGVRSLRPMNRALAIALQDDSPEVRKNAIRDLTRIYDLVVQISQMLGHAVEDEDPEVRKTATWALEQLNRIRRLPNVDASFRSLKDSSTQDLSPYESDSDETPV